MTGYSIDEIKGVRPGALLNMNLSDDEMKEITTIVKSGGTWSGELNNRKKNGEQYWELASITSIRNENGEITHYMAVEEDITLRKKIEEQLKERNEIIEKEISIAEMVQSTLLCIDVNNPSLYEADFKQISVEKIGGDFLAINSPGNDELGIFIGDISGHGVASALFISLMKFITDDIYTKYSRLPVDYIVELNKRLLGYMSSYFITGIYAYIRYDRENDLYRMNYSSGGHPSPVILRKNGDIEILNSQGSLIGLIEDGIYRDHKAVLYKDDELYMYTDGLPETVNSETGKEIGFGDDMKNLFRESKAGSISSTIENLMENIKKIRGRTTIDDDLLVTGIKFK